LLPSTLVSIVTYAGVVLPTVMLTEGALSYLGFGVPSPVSSWGQMIAQGQRSISTAPWQAIIPAILFAVNILALYTIADWLRVKIGVKSADRTL
jgi:ABC-type dipeptide/oligopeptide/nickel transport system permease subunit